MWNENDRLAFYGCVSLTSNFVWSENGKSQNGKDLLATRFSLFSQRAFLPRGCGLLSDEKEKGSRALTWQWIVSDNVDGLRATLLARCSACGWWTGRVECSRFLLISPEPGRVRLLSFRPDIGSSSRFYPPLSRTFFIFWLCCSLSTS